MLQEMIHFIQTEFWHVAPMLVVAAFAIAIVFERSFALFMIFPMKNERAFMNKIQEMVMDGKIAEGVALCERYPTKMAAQIARKALLRAHQPEGLIENGLELAVEESIQRIQKRTAFLATFANVATLLGLFGTIAGLVASFKAVGSADPEQKAALLAQGISTAMNATMMGLGVAIPCMIAFSFLTNKSNRMVAEVETCAVRMMDVIRQRYFLAESRAASRSAPVRSVGNGGTGSFRG
jgi:biopolymer transport protein ExbB